MPSVRPSETSVPGGRQRLIEAALRLAARKSSVSSLGLRELAREAGLNPNTFYRHFKDLDELSVAIIEQFGVELRERRNQARRETTDFATFIRYSLQSYFEFAAEHPEAFILGFRELSLPSATSTAVKHLLDEVAQDIADIARQFGALQQDDDKAVLELAGFFVSGLFLLAIEYIEHKSQRKAVLAKANRYVALLLSGALALAPAVAGGTARSAVGITAAPSSERTTKKRLRNA
jgi:AcrR family transcriptional regulator